MGVQVRRKKLRTPKELKPSRGNAVPREAARRGGKVTASQMAARRIEVIRRIQAGEWPGCIPELAKAWAIRQDTVRGYRAAALDMLREGLLMRIEHGWGIAQAGEVAAKLCGGSRRLSADLQEQVLLSAWSTMGLGTWQSEAITASIFLRLRRAEEAAIAAGKPSAAVSAIKVEAELLGLYDAPPAHDDGRTVSQVSDMVDEIISTETP